MVDGLLQLLLPSSCPLCGGAADAGLPCAACRHELPWNRLCCPCCAQPQGHDALCAACAAAPPEFDRAWAPLRLQQPIQRSIHGLKYRAHFLQAHVLGRLLAEVLLRRARPLPQLLIPVPLHSSRLRVRGYNQALELARVITQGTSIPVAERAVRRVKATEDQIGKTAAQRRKNVRGAFEVKRDLQGLRIALLDDVMTTGATLGELARVCRKAGAAEIEAWAVARAP